MRIAQVAPLLESVPPRLYGGTERIVSYLTEELVRLGHEVTLFASGDSETSARLVAACPRALWHDPACRETLPHQVRQMEMVFEDTGRFDVVHFHTDYLQLPLLRREPCANVTTVHGELHEEDAGALLAEFREAPLVSISNAQRRPVPHANWLATIYHGLPRDLHTFAERPGSDLVFLGRVSPEKRLDRAIAIARGAGVPLRVAAKVHASEEAYFEKEIEPLLESAGDLVRFEGEVGGREKDAFLGSARALLFPIDWQEPFGLVMIEALACGTPVIAWRNGSIPEVLEHGVTGFVVESVEEAVAAVGRLDTIDRRACRASFERRFDAARMAREYVDAYRRVLETSPRAAAGAPGRRGASGAEIAGT